MDSIVLFDTFCQQLDSDLRLLSAEARKLEGAFHQIAGLFHSADAPNIKESCERALQRLRILSSPGAKRSMETIQLSPELLRPFLQACEFKNGKLITVAFSSFQKFVNNNAIGPEGRSQIIKAITTADKMKDENVAMRAFQAVTALIQDATYADDEAGHQQLLSFAFRVYCANQRMINDPTKNAAYSCIRQYVALIFDHALAPGGPPPRILRSESARTGAEYAPAHYGDTAGRENIAEKLLKSLVVLTACGNDAKQAPDTWLKCPVVNRTFLLDLLESVLKDRADAFHSLPQLTVALRMDVCALLEGLLRSALDPNVDVGSYRDVYLVIRCVGVTLRRHVALAPDKCASFVQILLKSVSNRVTPWQRLAVLQTLRTMCQDPMIIYRLFEMYDMAMDFDLNAVSDIVRKLSEVVQEYVRLADSSPQEDYVSILGSAFLNRQAGRDLNLELLSPDNLNMINAGSEVYSTQFALDCLLYLVASIEQLTDRHLATKSVADHGSAPASPARNSGPGPGGPAGLGGSGLGPAAGQSGNSAGGAPHSPGPTSPRPQGSQGGLRRSLEDTPAAVLARSSIKPEVLVNMCDSLWRSLLGALSPLMQRAQLDVLVSPLVKAYQAFIIAAGLVDVRIARDKFLRSLADFALTGPDDPALAAAAEEIKKPQADKVHPALLNTMAMVLESRQQDGYTLSAKNVAALKALFTVTTNLSDELGDGDGWLYIVDVVCCLDHALISPYTTSASTSNTPEGYIEMSSSDKADAIANLASAVTGVFQNSSHMSSASVVSLMVALMEASQASLPKQWSQPSPPRLHMLNRMVDILLQNKHRVLSLWQTCLEAAIKALDSSNPMVRLAALSSLDASLTGVLPGQVQASQDDGSGTPGALTPAESVQVTLLTALANLWHSRDQLDVRRGLLRIVYHVLQHHGEDITRGWDPLLTLLLPVPKQQDVKLVQLGFLCIELVCSDFLPFLPKEYIPRALDVVALYAQQDVILNVSLTAVTMLWSVTDTLARVKRTVPTGASTAIATANRRDVSEAEAVAMLMIAFKALKAVSTDSRPEVRNSAVRTLFLAMGAHGGKFDQHVLHECVWDMMLPAVASMHHMSETSSNEEVAASELGRDKSGKSVKMLMHHSRNTEQKQWEETLVLALAGATKVLRAHLPAIVVLPGFQDVWEQLMQVAGLVLRGARRGTTNAAITLITTLIQAHGGAPEVMGTWMWKSALRALDQGMKTIAVPLTHAPLQARTELLSSLAIIHSTLREQLGAEDVRLILGWMDRMARYPMGAEDSPAMHAPSSGGLGPIQKGVLAVVQQLAPPPPAATEVWPDMLLTLCTMLRPFRLLPFRPVPGTPALSPLKSVPLSTGTGTDGGAGTPTARGISPTPSLTTALPRATTEGSGANGDGAGQGQGQELGSEDINMEARCLSSAWMCRIAETAAGWYKDSVPWQVRVATFPALVGALSECMAMRHVDPADELWRAASRAFNAVVQSGLPSINIASHAQSVAAAAAAASAHQGYSLTSLTSGIAGMAGYASAAASPSTAAGSGAAPPVPVDSWPLLVRAFEMALLGRNLPGALPAGTRPNPPLASASSGTAGGAGTTGGASSHTPMGTPAGKNGGGGVMGGRDDVEGPVASPMSDVEVQALVLDCLADTVLTSCQYTTHEMRVQLVSIIDAGAAVPMAGEEGTHVLQRFSHACLSKLYVLCSRGQDIGGTSQRHGSASSSQTSLDGGSYPRDQSARCQLEVSQIALPAFLSRCEAVLRSYLWEQRAVHSAQAAAQGAADTGASIAAAADAASADATLSSLGLAGLGMRPGAAGPDGTLLVSHSIDAQLADRALHVLELCAQLRVSPAVIDAAVGQRPELKPWIELVRARRRRGSSSGGGAPTVLDRTLSFGGAGQSHDGGTSHRTHLTDREQTHLLPLYGVLCECVVCDDGRVRDVVRQLLLAVGRELGLAPAGDPLAFQT